jgi:hypothetical protein
MSAETYIFEDNHKPIFDVLVVLNKKNYCIAKKRPEFVLNTMLTDLTKLTNRLYDNFDH